MQFKFVYQVCNKCNNHSFTIFFLYLHNLSQHLEDFLLAEMFSVLSNCMNVFIVCVHFHSGDEVVVIQGKLDGIKTRYSEINTMSNSVSKTLDKALSLATKLQNTHEELNAWLEKVESELATFKAQEPVGEQLTHLQDRQKVSDSTAAAF